MNARLVLEVGELLCLHLWTYRKYFIRFQRKAALVLNKQLFVNWTSHVDHHLLDVIDHVAPFLDADVYAAYVIGELENFVHLRLDGDDEVEELLQTLIHVYIYVPTLTRSECQD